MNAINNVNRIIWFFSIAFVTIAVLCFSCGQAKKNHVRIAYFPSSSCLPLFVAIEKGFFKDAGIEIEALRCGSTNDALNAVLAGRADGTPGFGISSYCAIEAKAPGEIKIYLPCVENESSYANNLLVPINSLIKIPQELAGKKVGTFTSSTQLLYLKLMMIKILPPNKQWEIIQVDEKLQLQALTAGKFDALFAIEPTGTKAVVDKLARVLVANPRCKYIFSPFPAGANSFSSKFIVSNPQLAKKVSNIFLKAVQEIKRDPNGSRTFLAKYTPIEVSIADKVGIYDWWQPGKEDWQAVQRLSDLLYEYKLIPCKVNINKMLCNN